MIGFGVGVSNIVNKRSGLSGQPDTTAPTILSSGNIAIDENVTFQYELEASESVTWLIVDGDDMAQFEIEDNLYLIFSGSPSRNYESPADANTDNVYLFVLRAQDGAGNYTDQNVSVTVLDTAPVITSPSTKSVAEDAVLSHSLTANESVTWEIVGGADQARFEISDSTLRWLSNGTKDYETPNDADTNNTYIVQVRATDATGNTTNQTITVTVTDIFIPADIFAGGENGAWFPTNDLSSLFKSNSGAAGNVSANDDTIGLALDKRKMGALTATAYITAQSELKANGGVAVAGAATAATYNTTSGAGTATRVNGANISYVQWTGLSASSLYWLDIENTGATDIQIRKGGIGTTAPLSITVINAGVRVKVLTPTDDGIFSIIPNTNSTVIAFTVHSLKAISGNAETQVTSASCPKYKTATTSRKYDGADDVLIGTAKCGVSGNSIAAKITVPASISAIQVISGLQASTTTRFYVAVNTSGQLCAGVGTDAVTTIIGTTDIRGQTGVAMLVEDGTSVFLYWNGNLEYTGARNGIPSATPVYYEGALNNNGTAASFFAGEIYDRITVQRAITAPERANLLTYWS